MMLCSMVTQSHYIFNLYEPHFSCFLLLRQKREREHVAGGRVGHETVRNANICHFWDKGTCVQHAGSNCCHAYHASKCFLWRDSKGNSTHERLKLGHSGEPVLKHAYHLTIRALILLGLYYFPFKPFSPHVFWHFLLLTILLFRVNGACSQS